MKYINHSIAQMIAVLLILQTGVACALPPGGHLNLCIGSDGHFDIGIAECSTDLVQPPGDLEADTKSSGHHGDCLDIVFGCADLGNKVLRSAAIQYAKTTFRENHISPGDQIAAGQIDSLSANRFRQAAVFDGSAQLSTDPSQKSTTVLIF